MISDRALVLLLVSATVALLAAATVTGDGAVGWAAIAAFAASVAAYVRWRLRRRQQL